MGLKNLHDQIHAGVKSDRNPSPVAKGKKVKGKQKAHAVADLSSPVGVGPPARAAMPAVTGIPPIGKLKQ